MKKIIFFLFVTVATIASAQYVNDGIPRDTVRNGDPWFLFKPETPLYERDQEISFPPGFNDSLKDIWVQDQWRNLAILNYGESENLPVRFFNVQEYNIDNDSSWLYGIAITILDTLPLLAKGLHLHYLQPVYHISDSLLIAYGPSPEAECEIYVDTILRESVIQTHNALRKDCIFEYNLLDNSNKPINKPSHCYEFYFDYPVSLTRRDNPIWIGGRAHWYNDASLSLGKLTYIAAFDKSCNQDWISLRFSGSQDHGFGYYRKLGFLVDTAYYSLTHHSWGGCCLYETWGLLFPIVKLRCVAPRLSLVERNDDGSATLAWRQYDTPETYQFAFGEYDMGPEGATLLSTTDTIHHVSGLTDGVHYGAWVRKACRFTTAGYDTLVWSNWSNGVDFYLHDNPEGINSAVARNGVRLYPNPADDEMTVQSRYNLELIELHDMIGSTVYSIRANGHQVTLPLEHLHAGPYIVTVQTGNATTHLKLIKK